MTFRGIFKDGVIVPGTDLGLRNGAEVEFELLRSRGGDAAGRRARARKRAPRRGAARVTSSKLTAAQRVALVLKFAGDWKKRADWKGRSSADIAAELRRRLARRDRNG
jgi:hypothetical protein